MSNPLNVSVLFFDWKQLETSSGFTFGKWINREEFDPENNGMDRFRIRTCACCRISGTRSGSCPTSRPATRWQLYWPKSTTSSGATIKWRWPPVRQAIGSGFDTKTITLSCGKLTTGVHHPAVVVNPGAAQPEVAGNLLPGSVSRAVTVVHQEPQRRRPERGGNPQIGLFRVRLHAYARCDSSRNTGSGFRPASRIPRWPSRTSCRSCPCWLTTART
jgi:hypothetical protein